MPSTKKRIFNLGGYEFPSTHFRKRLDEVMRSENPRVTQEQLASELGIKEQRTVGQWLRGVRAPKGRELAAIAQRFGVTIDWLVGVPGAPRNRRDYTVGEGLPAALVSFIERELGNALNEAPSGLPITRINRLDGERMMRALLKLAREDVQRWNDVIGQRVVARQLAKTAQVLNDASGKTEPFYVSSVMTRIAEWHERWSSALGSEVATRPRLRCFSSLPKKELSLRREIVRALGKAGFPVPRFELPARRSPKDFGFKQAKILQSAKQSSSDAHSDE